MWMKFRFKLPCCNQKTVSVPSAEKDVFEEEQATPLHRQCEYDQDGKVERCQLIYGHDGPHFARTPRPPVVPLTTRPITRYEKVGYAADDRAGNDVGMSSGSAPDEEPNAHADLDGTRGSNAGGEEGGTTRAPITSDVGKTAGAQSDPLGPAFWEDQHRSMMTQGHPNACGPGCKECAAVDESSEDVGASPSPEGERESAQGTNTGRLSQHAPAPASSDDAGAGRWSGYTLNEVVRDAMDFIPGPDRDQADTVADAVREFQASAPSPADGASPLPTPVEEAWSIIANAWGGDWDRAPHEWRQAAERWRDAYVNSGLWDTPADGPFSGPESEVRALHGFLQHIAHTVGLGPDIESYDDVCNAVDRLAGSASRDLRDGFDMAVSLLNEVLPKIECENDAAGCEAAGVDPSNYCTACMVEGFVTIQVPYIRTGVHGTGADA